MPGASILMLAASVGAAGNALPDIEIKARVQAREVTIEQQGKASARVRLEPDGADKIEVERNLPRGQRTYRNLDIKLNVEGRLVDPPIAPRGTSAQSDLQADQGD